MSKDLNGFTSTEDIEESSNTVNSFMDEPWYSASSAAFMPTTSRRQNSPFNNYSGHSLESDYWAFKPLNRPNPPDRAVGNTIHQVSSFGRGRSVSFSDPPPTVINNTGYYRSSSPNQLLFRDRMYSVPSLPHCSTSKEFDFPLVDDIFPPPSSHAGDPTLSNDPHLSEVMRLSDIASIGRKKEPLPGSMTRRGWLEVSIDSTMPSASSHVSSGLHKDSLSLSDLQTTLPTSPLLPKRANVSSPTGITSGIATAGVLGGSCLLKKLMPSPSEETYSRKVFIGGLPPDIDQEEIRMSFQKYGAVTIDWPHKIYSKSRVPPKGYAFLLFKDEGSVHKLLACCISENDKLFSFIKYYVSGTTITRKKCQIRPWKITESYYFATEDKKVDSRKAVFVGGVPRPLKASELAEVMSDKFGPVSFVAIDCDAELKYPKGAACVVFATHASYIAAVSSRFMQLVFGPLEKKVEVKPYILEDQLCDECNGIQSDGQPAPFFCGSVTCLKYYCEHCWATYHSLSGRQNHRPMFKDIFDRDKFT